MPVDTLVRGRAVGNVDAATKLRVVARVRLALRALARSRSSVTLVFTDDDEIRTLNRDYRQIDRATDVLSFHLQDLNGEDDPAGEGVNLGDIVISIETARRRSPGRRYVPELERLAIHGLCHLFGHDHKRPPEAKVMFALERRLRRLPLPGAGARAVTRSGARAQRPSSAGRAGSRPPRRRAARGRAAPTALER